MSGWFKLAKTHFAFDVDGEDIAFTPHDGGFLCYRISACLKRGNRPVYCGYGNTMDEAAKDFNAGIADITNGSQP